MTILIAARKRKFIKTLVKINLSIKILLKILLLAFFLIISTAKADEPTNFDKASNSIYDFIHDHEYLLVPLVNAAGGLSLCGPWCAVAGGIAGATEEGLNYYGVTNKRYLTYGILGGATGNMLTPALTSTGVLTGLLFDGLFKGNEELVAPAFTATLGMQAGGSSGLVLGALGGTLDAFARQEGLTNKYPISSFILVPKFLYATLGPGIATIVTLGLNLMIYNEQGLSEIFKNPSFEYTSNLFPMGGMTKTYARVFTKLYENYNKLIPEKEFKEHIEKNFMALLGGQLLIHWFVVKQIKFNQNMEYNFEHLDQIGRGAVLGNQLISQGIKFAVFIIPWTLSQAMTSGIERYYDDRLSVILKDNIQNKLFSNENLLRLSNNKYFSMYMDNLNRDTAVVTNLGSALFSGAISTSVSGAYGASMVIIHSRSLLFYTFLYQMVQGLIAQQLAAQSMAYDDTIRFLNSELLDIYKDTKEHVRTITERDGIAATEDKVQKLSTALIEASAKQNLWDMGFQLFMKSNQVLTSILNYCLVGREIRDGRLTFENRNLLRKAVMDESEMFSWGDRNLPTVGQVERSLDRLIVLEGIIDLPPSKLDQIERIIQSQNQSQLILKNLEIGVGERKLVAVDELKLTMGKVYAITGDTGCGKTSLLSKIKGIKENGIYGKGKIYYPKVNNQDPKIVMLSQQDYFPMSAALKEVITYPDKFPEDPKLNRERKKELAVFLRELGLNQFLTPELNLESKRNWYTLLSGGEKKKILILSAIVKKPDILILDEIFNGLDQDSIKNVQKVLKKYLPNSLILVVDHHAKDNNFNFYDSEIHFVDKRLIARKFNAINTDEAGLNKKIKN